MNGSTVGRRGGKQREVDAGAEYLGAAPELVLGEAAGDVESIVTEVGMDDVAHEVFMNDLLTIIVASNGADDETPSVPVGVNGSFIYLPRDIPIDVKRKYVEVLARAKKTDYDQTLDIALGERMNKLTQRHVLKYPFTVIHDPDARGHQWLREILAQRR